MATIKAEYYRFDGSKWDLFYFKTTMDMVEGLTAALANLDASKLSGTIPDTVVQTEWDTAYTHSQATGNAHSTTFAQLNSKPTTLSGYGITDALNVSLKGAANGLAELDANGKVPSSQLPSYVDDVLEYAKLSDFPETGEAGKIYIAKDTNKTYRWSGSDYTEISASLALGTTSSTAFRGDYGNTAYAHSQATGNAHSTTFAQLNSKPTTLSGYGITDALNVSLKGAANGLAELDANGKVAVANIANFAADDGEVWVDIGDAIANKTLVNHIIDLYSTVRNLRGTAKYNTSSTQTIAGAYTHADNIAASKNKTEAGSTLPGTSGYVTGDLFFKTLA